jgi:hypothetical protein
MWMQIKAVDLESSLQDVYLESLNSLISIIHSNELISRVNVGSSVVNRVLIFFS